MITGWAITAATNATDATVDLINFLIPMAGIAVSLASIPAAWRLTRDLLLDERRPKAPSGHYHRDGACYFRDCKLHRGDLHTSGGTHTHGGIVRCSCKHGPTSATRPTPPPPATILDQLTAETHALVDALPAHEQWFFDLHLGLAGRPRPKPATPADSHNSAGSTSPSTGRGRPRMEVHRTWRFIPAESPAGDHDGAAPPADS